MPEMGGRELTDRLSQLRPEMKVLYMSGYTDNAIVHQGVLDEGANFIQKPFAPQQLARKVIEVLGEERRGS
jgi:FixJ family two-component response regulator